MRMRFMIIDLEVALPSDISIEIGSPEGMREVRVLKGASVSTVASAIEVAATAAGFAPIRATPRDLLLRRDAQAIYLFQQTDTTLVVRVEDPAVFPVSRVNDLGVQIHDIDLGIVATRIVPGREQHISGSHEWSADWTIFGRSAEDLSVQLQAAFLKLGLQSNGVWAPPEGMDRWKVEAYSAERLLQAEIFAKPDRCELKIHLVTS